MAGNWQKLLDDFWRDFKAEGRRGQDQKPSEIPQALDEFLSPRLYPPRAVEATRASARNAETTAIATRRQVRRVRRLSNYLIAVTRRNSARAANRRRAKPDGPRRWDHAQERRFGPYVERGEKRA